MRRDNTRNRPETGPQIQRLHEPDRQAMLAALRVVLVLRPVTTGHYQQHARIVSLSTLNLDSHDQNP